MIVYLIIRSQSTNPTKPKLSIDCQPIDDKTSIVLDNEPKYEYDEVTIYLETTKGGIPFKIGAGIPKNAHSSCQIRKSGTDNNGRGPRECLLKYALLDIRGAMLGRKVVMNWTPKRGEQHDCAYVQEGDDLHYWWELVTIEVFSK